MNRYQCDLCDDVYTNYSEMIVHKQRHFGGPSYKCLECEAVFTCGAYLKNHALQHKQKQTPQFPCTQCEKKFDDQASLIKHSSVHYDAAFFYPSEFQRNPQQFDHTQVQLPQLPQQAPPIPVQQQQQTSYDQRYLSFQNFAAPPEQQPQQFSTGAFFSCAQCVQLFPDDEALQKHMKSKHANLQQNDHQNHQSSQKRKWPCSFCDYSTDKKSSLQHHIVTHSKVKPFKCDECGKSYTKKSSLTTHIKCIHTKELNCTCDICHKLFTKRSSMMQHIKSVHDKIKSFVCIECGKQFTVNSSLTTHMRTHTNEKPFQCPFCGESFSRGSSLSQHITKNH